MDDIIKEYKEQLSLLKQSEWYKNWETDSIRLALQIVNKIQDLLLK